jgi:hypothetical protein
MDTGDLRNLSVAASSKMPLRDPRSGKPFVFADGSQCFIELASPDSVKYKTAYYSVVDNAARRPRDETTEKDLEDDKLTLAANTTISWNIVLDGTPVPCTFDDIKRLYGHPEFGWLLPQIQSWQMARANFMQPLQETSGDTEKATQGRPSGAASQ